MNTLTYWLNKLLFALLIFIMLSIVIVTYLYVFDKNPATVISNSPLPVNKAVYHSGEAIIATIEYCRYTNVPTITYISFVNDLIFDVPSRTITGAPIGCGTVQGKIVTIPNSLPPGTYHLVGKNEYKVNFFATRYVEWYSEPFEVIK